MRFDSLEVLKLLYLSSVGALRIAFARFGSFEALKILFVSFGSREALKVLYLQGLGIYCQAVHPKEELCEN